MDNILENVEKQLGEKKLREAAEKLQEVEKEMGVTFIAKMMVSENGIVPFIDIVPNEPNTKTEGDSKG